MWESNNISYSHFGILVLLIPIKANQNLSLYSDMKEYIKFYY